MYANVDDLIGFTKAVVRLLANDGVFVIQTGYHPEQMKLLMFDYIYHEHFSYFTLSSLKLLLENCRMEIIDVFVVAPKGGSIRVVAQKKGGRRTASKEVKHILQKEIAEKINSPDFYHEFALKIDLAKQELYTFLEQVKSQNKTIVAIGASHSTTTLTYHFELALFIDYIVDDNSIKQGTYSPGYHIPVYPTSKIYEDKPDYVLILAWQHQETILKKHESFREQGGVFIVPLPSLKLIN